LVKINAQQATFLSNLSEVGKLNAPMRAVTRSASSEARRAITRNRRANDLVWPSTDQGLGRRRDGALVVATVFRTLTGRDPNPPERADLLERVRHGLDFEGLVEEVLSMPEVLEQTVTRGSDALRDLMEQQIRGEDPPGGTPPTRVVFMHIMRTGGTSLSAALRQWVGPSGARVGIALDELAVMPRPQLARLRVLAGHIPHQALEITPGGFQTVTLLREPVARTLSQYRELRDNRGYDDLSLDEFLGSEVFDVISGNYQARVLAHTIDLDGAWITYSPLQRYQEAGGEPDQPYPLQALFDSTPLVIDDDSLLAEASQNLSRVDHVGVTENLHGLAARVSQVLGIQDASVPFLNASRSTTEELSTRVRRLIEKRTLVDRELYQLALQLSA
jgi:hypothetical protein